MVLYVQSNLSTMTTFRTWKMWSLCRGLSKIQADHCYFRLVCVDRWSL